ncbi:MAG TPA: hypothetical protein VGK63_08890, partial [Candidatus Limnocylindrales bacterium]
MLPDMAAASRRRRQHEHTADGPRSPSEAFAGDGGCESRLLIKLSDRGLYPAELRLHLDDEKRQRTRVEGEDVDRATFAEHAV